MQVMALGKWSKEDGKWRMVVAMRRPNGPVRGTTTAPADRPQPLRRPNPTPEKR